MHVCVDIRLGVLLLHIYISVGVCMHVSPTAPLQH